MTFIRFLGQLFPCTSSHHHHGKSTEDVGVPQGYHQHDSTHPTEAIAEIRPASPNGRTPDSTPALRSPRSNKRMAHGRSSTPSLDSLSSTPPSSNPASPVFGSDSRTVHVGNAMSDSNLRRPSLALPKGGEDYYHSDRVDDHEVYRRRSHHSRHRGHRHERPERYDCDCHKYDSDTRRKHHRRRTSRPGHESTGSLTPEDSLSFSYDKKAKVLSSYHSVSGTSARRRSRPEVVRPEPISLLWPHALLESTLTPNSPARKPLVVHT